MDNYRVVKIGEFLFEREGKYKPNSEIISGLKRIDKIDFSGNFHIATKPSKTDMILVRPGDLVISGINVAKGAMGIYHGDEDVAATIHYSSYTFDTSKIDLEYFKRFLKSAEFIRLLKEQVKGGIKTEIKPKHLLPLEINLPNITEQKRILAHFQSIEYEDAELKSQINHQQSLLKKLRQQILQEAIEGKLSADWRQQNPKTEPASELLKRIQAEKAQLIKNKKIKPQKTLPPIRPEEKTFALPDGWEWCRLEDAGLFERGKSKHRPRNDETLFIGGKYPFIQTGDIAQSKKHGFRIRTYSKLYNDKGLSQSRLWEKETLCITIAANIAETGFLDIAACFPDSVVGFKSFEDSSTSYYVKYFIDATRHEIEKFAPATAQKNINLGIINMLLFPLPPLAEQKAIVAKVEKLLALCDQLESKINQSQHHANSLMQAVLQEAFAGASI